MKTVTYEKVLQIHNALVEEFRTSENPIFQPGIKDDNLLHSAISRQHTSLGGQQKYIDPYSNAATILFGIILDHPFHNGNKRTAIVTTLVHLDKNDITIINTSEDELYQFLVDVAQHQIIKTSKHGKTHMEIERPNQDQEVEAIAEWIRLHSKEIVKGDWPLSPRQLRRILGRYGYELDKPKGNKINVYRIVNGKRKHIGNTGYQNEKAELSIMAIKELRKLCRLREVDGIDSEAFYGEGVKISGFINHHRKLIKHLANK
jgi:death-on-curing protein